MKLNKFTKRLFSIFLTSILIFGVAISTYAAAKTYSFSDLDIEIQVPTELYVFTRNVTSADKNLELINTTADKLHVMFEQNDIYLEAFSKDITYELVVSGKSELANMSDFNTLDDYQINLFKQSYKEKCEQVLTDEITNVTTYKNDSTLFYVVDFKSVSNDLTVYAKKYYTVMQGHELYFTIQSNNIPINDMHSSQLKSVVDSVVYKPIKPSLSESPIFTEVTGFLIGLLITVVVLGGFIYVVTKSTQKQKVK